MRATMKVIAICLALAAVLCFPRATHFRKHTATVSWAVVSADARYIASASLDDGTVRIWDVAARKQLAVLTYTDRQIQCVEFSPDGNTVATGEKATTITLWNVADGKKRFQLQGHTDAVKAVAFSPDGKTLASGSMDKTVKVWDLATTKELFAIQPGHDWVAAVAFSPDGTILACGGWVDRGCEIQLRDAKTGKELRCLKKAEGLLHRLLFSPNSATLCSVGHCRLNVWDVATGKALDCDNPKWLDHGDYVESLAFSPDNRTLVAGHEQAIGLWDVASGKNTITFTNDGPNHYLPFSDRLFLDPETQHAPTLAAAAFKSNGDLMVVGTRFETVAFWRLTSVPQKK